MKKLTVMAGIAAFALFIASCASTPPQKPAQEPAQPEPAQPEAVQPQAAQPEQPAVPAPEAQRTQARALKDKIDGYGLADYDQEDYQAASRDLQAGEDAYGNDNATAKKSLDSAIDGFNAVIAKGGPLLVAAVQDKTETSKQAADALLASVAVKDDYAKANDAYQRGLQEKDSGDLESAGKDFSLAAGLFDAAATAAQQKKDVALHAIGTAQQDLGASEQKAAEAEKSLADEGIAAQESAR
jgi:hypothetical protein